MGYFDSLLLGYWGEEHKDPWLVLTDLAPECADACWYGLRAWIEQGFKRSKRGGWQWQHTRMDDPVPMGMQRVFRNQARIANVAAQFLAQSFLDGRRQTERLGMPRCVEYRRLDGIQQMGMTVQTIDDNDAGSGE